MSSFPSLPGFPGDTGGSSTGGNPNAPSSFDSVEPVVLPETKPEDNIVFPPDLFLKPESDLFEGFGVERYDIGFKGVAGEKITGLNDDKLKNMEIISFVDSTRGVFEFDTALDKTRDLQVDIINPSIIDIGFPHYVVEDTFEWVNSGLPSHLSQVSHSNLINIGIKIEKEYPGAQSVGNPPFQGKFIAPCDRTWYDTFNSTVDYEQEIQFGNLDLELPYAVALLHIPELDQVWVGGLGGIIAISTIDLSITSVDINFDLSNSIKDLKKFDDEIFILTDKQLHIFNISTNKIITDRGLNLPDKLNIVQKFRNRTMIIGAIDGVYIRRDDQIAWVRIIESSNIISLIIPDAIFAISETGTLFSSVTGLSWNNKGNILSRFPEESQLADILKFSVSSWIAIGKELYRDDGTLYTEKISLTVTEIFDDSFINDLELFDDNLYFALSDGRYGFLRNSSKVPGIGSSDDGLEVNTNIFTDSDLPSIHKIIDINNDLWLFGYDRLKIRNKDGIFRLATGIRV